jgi:hypothetical protein
MSALLGNTIRLLTVALLAATSSTAGAQYSQTVGAESGPVSTRGDNDITLLAPPFTAGLFTGIPAGTITSATISGSFGGSGNNARSGPAQIFLNSVMVAECQTDEDCEYNDMTPFSFTFDASNFSALMNSIATLTVVPTDPSDNNNSFIRLGPTTLSIDFATTTTTTPEPATTALLATGLMGLVPILRRRRR